MLPEPIDSKDVDEKVPEMEDLLFPLAFIDVNPSEVIIVALCRQKTGQTNHFILNQFTNQQKENSKNLQDCPRVSPNTSRNRRLLHKPACLSLLTALYCINWYGATRTSIRNLDRTGAQDLVHYYPPLLVRRNVPPLKRCIWSSRTCFLR